MALEREVESGRQRMRVSEWALNGFREVIVVTLPGGVRCVRVPVRTTVR
jgi:hypothetical protein